MKIISAVSPFTLFLSIFLRVYAGLWLLTMILSSVMLKYFAFLVFNVFLVSTIAGAILKVIEKIRRNPEEIILLLASSLPQQASFFINYIMVEGTSSSISTPKPAL